MTDKNGKDAQDGGNRDEQHDREPPWSDADLESLLALGHRPDPRRAAILSRVLEQVGARHGGAEASAAHTPRRQRWWVPRWRSTAVLAGAALAGSLLLISVRPRPVRDPAWTARGAQGGAFPVEVGCSGGTLDSCPMGSTLIFRSQLTGAPAYLGAYAEPLSGHGQRIWYMAGPDAPLLRTSDVPLTATRGIRVGPEHVPGVYTLRLLLTRRPLLAGQLAGAEPANLVAAKTVRLVVTP